MNKQTLQSFMVRAAQIDSRVATFQNDLIHMMQEAIRPHLYKSGLVEGEGNLHVYKLATPFSLVIEEYEEHVTHLCNKGFFTEDGGLLCYDFKPYLPSYTLIDLCDHVQKDVVK